MAQVRDVATMSVYEGFQHRIEGPVDPLQAFVNESLGVFSGLLRRLQEQGVKPGARLLISIEEL